MIAQFVWLILSKLFEVRLYFAAAKTLVWTCPRWELMKYQYNKKSLSFDVKALVFKKNMNFINYWNYLIKKLKSNDFETTEFYKKLSFFFAVLKIIFLVNKKLKLKFQSYDSNIFENLFSFSKNFF